MRLYGYFRSSTSFRVRIAMNLKGLAYEAVPVNLLKGEQKADLYRAVNPHGRVPALVLDDGRALIQSPAILEYLEEAHPEPPLLPKDPAARAEVRAACAVIACDIHPINNSGTLAYLRERLGQDQASLDAWMAHWIQDGLAAVERLIRPGPYAFGAEVTLADVYIAPQIFNARRFHVPLDAFPKVVAAAEAAMELPAVAEAAPERQADAA